MGLKRITAVFLTAVICIFSIAAGVSAEDAGITLNKSSITMTLGMSYTLKPTLTGIEKGSVTWSTSDKSVVSVAKGGVIKARKTGTAEITVKVKDTGYCAVCKVKVRLPKTSEELARSMGAGWSLTNSLDVCGADYIDDIKDYETAWGNPRVSKKLINAVKKAGFSTICIPVGWADHMSFDGEISVEWLDRVQEVVDYAYESDMYVILSTHDGWISVSDEENMRKKYRRMWAQIADRFKDYDEKLIFQGMSETYCIDEPSGVFPVSGRKVLNNFYSDFSDIIRKSGGLNEKRFLIAVPADSNAALKLPDDDRMLVGVTNLAPYKLSDSSSSGKSFDENARSEIDQSFEQIKSDFTDKGISVVITQWGLADKSNDSERIKAAEYFVRTAKKNGIPCVWAGWIDGLIDRKTLKWSCDELTDTITA